MRRVAIAISGGGSNMVALVRSMTGAHPARPCLVVADRPEAGGLARAAALGVATAVVDHRALPDRTAFEAALQARLSQARAEIVCLAGFMRVLTPGFVAGWAGRILNVHPSLLPDYKGLHTHRRVLADGARQHGCTVHTVTAALDDGPVLGQARLAVQPEDTEAGLAARVQALEHELYPRVLRRVAEGNRTPVWLP